MSDAKVQVDIGVNVNQSTDGFSKYNGVLSAIALVECLAAILLLK